MAELFLKIINMSISASWLVLALLVLRLVMKKAPKWVNVLLWGIVAVRLICPFSIESTLSLIPSTETISPEIMMDWTPEISTGIDSLDRVVNPVISEVFAPEPIASANPLQILIPVAANLWLLGVLLMLLYTVASYLSLHRKLATAVILRDNIFQSEHVDSPFVFGIFRPKIYLPFEMDAQEMGHVIAHEQAHIRCKDHWWKPLGFLLLTIHWFNPLLWLAYTLFCRDMELACDEKVIQEMGSEQRADYTQALVNCSVNHGMIAACPLAFGEVGVKARVKSVMNYRKPTRWVLTLAVFVCAVVAVCFLTDPKQRSEDETLHLGLNAEIIGIEADAEILYVKDMDENAAVFGERCAIDCAKAIREYRLIYVNYDGEGDVKSIGFDDFWVGDAVTIDLYGSQKQQAFNNRATAEQIQLATQRMNPPTVIHYPAHKALFEPTPAEEVGEKYDNEELVITKLHYENLNGEWVCEGYTYKYRLEISGRLNNAAKNMTYIVLSNTEDITFDQTWRASGLSSNMDDYFDPADAVIVGSRLFS